MGHRQRWVDAGKPDLAVFSATTSPGWVGHRPLLSCEVAGCLFGRHSRGMCPRHVQQWTFAERPEPEAWRMSAAPLSPPSPLPRSCLIAYCDLWVQGRSRFCRTHDRRWSRFGRPDADEFARRYEDEGSGGSEHIDLRRLPAQLKLEIQYVLQCRRDEVKAKIVPGMVQRIANALAGAGVTSLLDQPEQHWRLFRPTRGGDNHGWAALLCDAHRRVEELAYGRGWDVEYPRDTWRLRNLGFPSSAVVTVRFDRIPQPWLKDLVKRWVRWRLIAGLNTSSVAKGVRALARLGAFLADPRQRGVGGLGGLDRALLERYLADLHTEMSGRKSHLDHISSLNAFLLAVRQHGWGDGTLPADAVVFSEDYPRRPQPLPRALTEQVMAQLEDPANLNQWADLTQRLITLILMRCGLRVTDACRLPHDCIVRDADGAPYLRYRNHKMKREALVPIDEELRQLITEQQGRVLATWCDGSPHLFPRSTANLDASRPYTSCTYRQALYRWIRRRAISDEHGRPVRLTPHQWRHTLGTRLINLDVPQEVVRRILDHDSAQMTSHYARLHDTTVRRHWEQTRKVNISGDTVTFDPNGPLAEAAWAKQRLSRATHALPNGYCGLPLVQSCPHANSCLTCPMFLTTAEFLPQHRQHHQQTLRIISTAEARGQTRMVEMNRHVADNLTAIITSLEADGAGQEEVADAS